MENEILCLEEIVIVGLKLASLYNWNFKYDTLSKLIGKAWCEKAFDFY